MANPRRKRKGFTPARMERAMEATKLRKDGHSYAVIGERLGVNPATAYRDVTGLLEQTATETADELRALELARLDEMWQRATADLGRAQRAWKRQEHSEDGITPVAMEKVVNATQKVFQTQLRIMERRARMMGLDSFNAQVSFEGADAISQQLAVIGGMSPETLAEMGAMAEDGSVAD